MILYFLEEAEVEAEAARCYLNRQSNELGDKFANDLAERLAAVAENPLRFPKLETLPDDYPYRRALLNSFRYVVVFEVLATMIVVIAVAHTSRAPNYWLDRT